MSLPDRVWHISAAARIRFRVALNPVRRHGNQTMPVPTRSIPAWIQVKLAGVLDEVQVLNITQSKTRARRSRNQPGPPSLVIATVDGLATVRDADAFIALRSRGIGRAKAYGAGLLTAQRIA